MQPGRQPKRLQAQRPRFHRHHHPQANDLGWAVEITERIFHPPTSVVIFVRRWAFHSAFSIFLAAFHDADDWKERANIAGQFEDQRLKHFAYRTVYAEAPDVLRPEHRDKIEGWIVDRIQGSEGDAPWTTLPAAIDEANQIQTLVAGDAAEHMAEVTAYLRELERIKITPKTGLHKDKPS